jgi:arylsulfatase A-like enzyme
LYDELVHVPLVVSGPGWAARRVSEPVSLVDFVPTVLEIVGAPADAELRGVSLVPWLRDEATAPHPPVMFEKHRALDDPQYGMLAWPYKVIRTSGSARVDIFDLERDPGEKTDLAHRLDAPVRQRLVGALEYWHRHVRRPFDDERRH